MARRTARIKHPLPTTMTIRFSPKDDELRDWLAQFAATNDMSKVVKLACYLLSGLQPDDGLLALLQRVEGLRQSETERQTPAQPAREPAQDALAAVMQELSALREALAQSRHEEALTSIHDYTKGTPADQPRRGAYAALEPVAPAPPPPVLPEFDAAFDPAPESSPSQSSGLDMARRRKRASQPAASAPAAPPAAKFDPREMLRILTQTTRQFGQEYQGH